jgi:hypothetical protein
MTDRSEEFRKAALRCLLLAWQTSDPSIRASLTLMAQNWLDLAMVGAVRMTWMLPSASSMKVRCDRGPPLHNNSSRFSPRTRTSRPPTAAAVRMIYRRASC